LVFGGKMKALLFMVAGLLTGAYFNTVVLSVASGCCAFAGHAIALLGQKIVQLAA